MRQLCVRCKKPLFGFGRCKCPIKKPKPKLVLADPEMTEKLCFVIGQMPSRANKPEEDIPCGA